jgi:hypothetical protein
MKPNPIISKDNKTWIETVSISKQDRVVLKIIKIAVIFCTVGTIYILAFALDIKNKISSFFSKEEHIKNFTNSQKDPNITYKEEKAETLDEKNEIRVEDTIDVNLTYREKAIKTFNELKVLIIKDQKPIFYALGFSFAYAYFGTPVIVGAVTYLYCKKD